MAVSDDKRIVRIDSLAVGGDGVGRLRTKACFVPLSAPGDLVRVRISEEKKSFIRSEIEEILEPGPGRIEPSCPLFGRCGGCQWLHVSIGEQLEAKRLILNRALGTDGVDGVGGVDKVEVLRSPLALGYRSLARLHFDSSLRALGFMSPDMKKPIDAEACQVLVPELSRLLPRIKKVLILSVESEVEVRLAAGLDGAAVLIESAAPLSADFYSRFAGLVGGEIKGALVSVDGLISTLAGDAYVTALGSDGEPLKEPVASFGQANRAVNALVGATVSDWVGRGGFSSALDLFAGAGNLTVVIARHASRTEAVERDRASCRAARQNISQRGLEKVTVTTGDALEIYSSVQEKFDLVVMDPPRTGHRDLAKEIAKGNQRAVLYVSCNPAALQRDLKELEGGGFRLTKALGFDMFPQTAHIEAAVLMER
jgi:23S rRNA (uracil1939-C5)-methyltransferase